MKRSSDTDRPPDPISSLYRDIGPAAVIAALLCARRTQPSREAG